MNTYHIFVKVTFLLFSWFCIVFFFIYFIRKIDWRKVCHACAMEIYSIIWLELICVTFTRCFHRHHGVCYQRFDHVIIFENLRKKNIPKLITYYYIKDYYNDIIRDHVFVDTGEIWSRLFEHRPFIQGEITFFLREFQVN